MATHNPVNTLQSSTQTQTTNPRFRHHDINPMRSAYPRTPHFNASIPHKPDTSNPPSKTPFTTQNSTTHPHRKPPRTWSPPPQPIPAIGASQLRVSPRHKRTPPHCASRALQHDRSHRTLQCFPDERPPHTRARTSHPPWIAC
jgi:hypothetical protein